MNATENQPAHWALASPSILLVALALLVPFAWLTALSFTDEGAFTLEHYQRITNPSYYRVFLETLKLSVVVTLFCVLLGYPLSYLMAQLSNRWAAVAMLFILLPFWTSLLVRTYAWLVILQRQGIINTMLMELGIISSPLNLVYNFNATAIGMIHVMLPFLILPLYANMRQIDSDLIRASMSLGATPRRAFWQVFLPLSLPGLWAGTVLVFVLCLGFYVTPAILGGGKVVTWALRIADAVTLYANWGAASALGVMLLVVTLAILAGVYLVFGRNRIGQQHD